MSFYTHILQSFYAHNRQPIDGAYRGKIRNIRLAFVKKYGENPEKKFDKFFKSYIILSRYNGFWTLEPGKFLYHFNHVERPELFRHRKFKPSSMEEVKKVLEGLT